MTLSLPPISGEQRAEIARRVRKLGEDAKVAIRAIRQEARKRMEETERGSHRGIQEATDAAGGEIDILHRSLRELCPLEPVLFRAVMG